MKSQKIKNKALELYILNVPMYKIGKQLNVRRETLYRWKNDYNWNELKEKAILKSNENVTELALEAHTLALKEMVKRLKNKPETIKYSELSSTMPRQTNNTLNLTKNETSNTAYQIIIPKEVEELLNESIQVNS